MSVFGSMYAAARILARDDMPIDVPGSERVHPLLGSSGPAMTRPVLGLPAAEGVPAPAPPPGRSTYQVLYAMASAVNDAWLDRLFSGTGAHRA